MRRLLFLLPTAALALLAASDADACGGFFARTTTKTVPSLRVEQVLVIHDPVKEEEHFIRELVFRDAQDPFGFVVPTPSKPIIAKASSPFVALAKEYPPEGGLRIGLRGGAPHGSGGGPKGGGASVTVLSKERIGSFTAFVLAATDAGALEKWLKDNDLTTTPESRAWLKHYVDVGFFFTAFRYEPDAKTPGSSAKSETVRISFATPLPFYPYREPEHPKIDAELPRVLAVWFVSPARAVPVANVLGSDGSQLKRPWTEDVTYEPAPASALRAMMRPLADLLPGAPTDTLVVQTFEDQKASRQGWGDVVLVPDRAVPIAPARRARIDKLTAAIGADK